jgi:hypothetical protein
VEVAVAWYNPAQWARLKQVAVDADNLDDSYEAWKRNAEGVERELRRKGIEIQRVHIDVEALLAWCQARHQPVSGEARSEYAAQLAAGDRPS